MDGRHCIGLQIEVLLLWSADTSTVDKQGETALLWAASGGHNDVVELPMSSSTVSRYADAATLTECGDRALHDAAKQGHKGVVELLLMAEV